MHTMKKFLIIVLSIASINMGMGQSATPDTKEKEVVKISETEYKVVRYHSNGTVKTESYYADNQPNGTWLGYDENGTIVSIQNYDGGMRTGTWIVMSKDGQSKYVTKYENNQQVSTEKIDATGTVIASR